MPIFGMLMMPTGWPLAAGGSAGCTAVIGCVVVVVVPVPCGTVVVGSVATWWARSSLSNCWRSAFWWLAVVSPVPHSS